jgi:hypothetical protein
MAIDDVHPVHDGDELQASRRHADVGGGVEELDQAKLTPLLRLKYHDSIADAVADLGKREEIGQVFSGLQKFLYQQREAVA